MNAQHGIRTRLALGVLLVVAAVAQAAPVIEGLTFALSPGKVYVPLDEAATALRWRVTHDPARKVVEMKRTAVPYESLRRMMDGTELVPLDDLVRAGARVRPDPGGRSGRVSARFRSFFVTVGPKRAEVNLAKQRLRAWQGQRLVLETRVSSGRRGSTPTGNYTAGPYKARRHFSSLYENAPMPWSVQVTGHVFIHGFTSVPNYPASHGCIRVPLTGHNPARFFYEWIDKGTPIRVTRG